MNVVTRPGERQRPEPLKRSRPSARASGSTSSAAASSARRAADADRRGRAARRHLEPVDLREGDRRQHRLRRGARRTLARSGDHDAHRHLRGARGRGHPATPPTCCARSTSATGRRDGYVSLEVSPYLARDTRRHASPRRGGCGRRSGAPNLMIKVPGTAGGRPGDPAADRRGHQHQRHAAVRRRARTRRWPRRTSPGWRRWPRSGERRRAASPAWPASSSAASTPLIDKTHRRAREGRRPRAARRSSACAARSPSPTPSWPTSATRSCSPAPRWQTLAGQRRAAAAAALGEHQHKNPAYRDVLYVEELIGRDTVEHHARPRRWTPSATTARLRDSLTRTSTARARRWRALEQAGISTRRR